MGMFDDLIPAQPATAAPGGGAPATVSGTAPAGGGGLFDDLIPTAAPGATPAAAAVAGPQSAGEALDMVEGTGSAAYDTGPGDGLTPWQRVKQLPGAAVAAADGFANSIPFTDRLAAGAAAATGLGGKFGDYSGNLAQLRKEEGDAMAAHPVAATVGEVAGGAAIPVGEVGFVAKGASLGAKALRGGVTGSAIGAAQGASSSSDLTDVGQTAKDAGVGATIGFGAGAIVPAAASGYGAVSRLVNPDTVGAIPGVANTARDVVLGAIDKDGVGNVQRNAALYGDPAMPFDYGTGLRGIAEGLATKDGPAASTIGDALGARQASTNQRVRTGLMDNFGPAQDPAAVKASIDDVQNAATVPLFARADAAGVPWSSDGDALMQRPAVATAMRGAAQDAANAGAPLPTVVLDEAGNPVASDAAMQAYDAGTRPAVTSALADMLGADPSHGPLSLEDALMAQRKAASDPLYQSYRSMQVPMTPELQDVLQRPSVQAALPAAERKAADQGRTIYASPANTPAPAAGASAARGSADIPDPFADLGQPYTVPPTSGAPSVQASAPPRPTGPAPVSLVSALQRDGGIQPSGETAAMGLDRFPGLVRSNGMSLDRAREMAAEAGYLGGDTARAMRETTPNDLIDALGNHPTYSVHDADAVAARQAWADHQAGQGAATSHDYAAEAVRSHLLDNGVPASTIDPATLDTAARFVDRHGMEPGHAWEAAATSEPFPGDTPVPRGSAAPVSAPATRQLTPEGLDYVKRALDDKVAAAQRGSDPSPDDARIYGGLKADLMGAIERHPDPAIADAYGAARQAYATPSREIDALHAGRAAIGDGVTPEQVGREFGALGTDGERQQYRNGVFNALRDKLGKASDTANFVRTVSGSQALRDKFAAVAPHPEALGRFNAAMDGARQTFTEAQRPTPQAWRATLDRLDARAAKGDAGAASARDALATHLGVNLDLARARGIHQDYKGLKDAVDYGRGSLAGGGDPVWPAGFAERYAAMTPAEQAAVRTGQRSLMEEAVGTKPNDQLAIKGLFQTGNTPGYTAPGVEPGAPDLSGWNAQKLAASYGHEPVARMQEMLNANDAFNSTFNGVVNNSKTARRQAMTEALADAEWKPHDLMKEGHGDDTALGLIRSIMAKGVNAVGHVFQNAPSNAVRDADLARIGTLQGPERDAMMGQFYDRLPAYQGREAMAKATEDRALMLASMLAGGGGMAAMDPVARTRMLAEQLEGRRRQ